MMTSFGRLTFLTLTCAVGVLWGATALVANAIPAKKTDAKGRIVILGDSLTAGYGLEPQQAYPALLQKRIDDAGLPYEVVNAGISGDTTAGGLRRIDWAMRGGADVLVVALGGNDGLRGVAPKQTEENIRGIVKRAREKNPAIAVVIAGMQMPANLGPQFVEAFSKLFPSLAKELNAALVPFLLEGVGGVAALNQPDRIHPTAEGQRKLADNVWPILERTLKEQQAKDGPSTDRLGG
ncbi:MAG: arylesterase [Chthoniobacteraceae bacterium]